jgi:hypothetical protein
MLINAHPKLNLTPEQNYLVQTLITQAEAQKFGECSWLGYGKPDQENQELIQIEEIHTPKQKNTGGSSEMDQEAVHKINMEMVSKGYRLLWWGHSHGTMSIFFATVHNAKHEATYDRLFWKSFDLVGAGELIKVVPPLLLEKDLKAHTSNWEKPTPPIQKFGNLYTTNGDYNNYLGNTCEAWENDFDKLGGSYRRTSAIHDGANPHACFETGLIDATGEDLIGVICKTCRGITLLNKPDQQAAAHYECEVCLVTSYLPALVHREPENIDTLIEQYYAQYGTTNPGDSTNVL